MSASRWNGTTAPSLDDLVALAEDAFGRLDEGFRRMVGDVIFRVQDFADEETLDALEIDDPFDLTGLYQGVDLASRSSLGPAAQPSVVFLYRRPILDEWVEHGELPLEELVAHVLIHEIGHHFGISDARIDTIEQQAAED